MSQDSRPETEPENATSEPRPEPPARLFLHEVGWQVALKFGSEREFCYLMSPGQDFYHRLYAGELYLHRSDEKLCLACARRRGLITTSPKHLERASIISAANLDPNSPEYDLAEVNDEY